MSRTKQTDELWRRLVAYTFELRDTWRRDVSLATGLPFRKLRVLRHLHEGPRTLSELAELVGIDPPATTVLVNDLEARGLVTREPHPSNRRAKIVSLTSAGRALMADALRKKERPPAAFVAAEPADLAAFARILDALEATKRD